jgi:DNA-binding NarL/FixJ family response regulator
LFAITSDDRQQDVMPRIRVLIRDAPNILRDILEQIVSSESDMELIPEPVVPLYSVVDQSPAPDVVIVGTNEPAAGREARGLLTRWPGSHILMITERGHRVVLHELLPRRVELGEMSPTQLVQTIRSATRPEGGQTL